MGWDSARDQVARALSAVQARDSALRGSATTLDIAILEAIVALDSDQSDAVQTLGAGNLVEYSDDGSVRPGELQRLAQLKAAFFGNAATGSSGLIAELRKLPNPETEAGGV